LHPSNYVNFNRKRKTKDASAGYVGSKYVEGGRVATRKLEWRRTIGFEAD